MQTHAALMTSRFPDTACGPRAGRIWPLATRFVAASTATTGTRSSRRPSRSASVVQREGRITGYATVVGFFGHAVAEGNDDLKALIGAAPSFQGPGFLLPTRNGDLMRWCLEQGLRVVQPMTLMSRGMYNEPAGAFLPSVLF